MKFDASFSRPATKILPEFGDDKITVTNRMLLKDKKPWLPVMAEFHYSRFDAYSWEEELQKLKDGGVDIVASYVFWIHHEEDKGSFDFSGNRNIRRFIELCHETGLEFCLRIGPWAHGECRNGGFPDWLCTECKDTLRSNTEPYIGYVRRYIHAVAQQVKGLPLFGIQIENEMTCHPEYLEMVRQMVVDEGLKAPLFTATAWGDAELPDTLLPMFGGYPEAPWTQNIDPMLSNSNFFFSHQRWDGLIGADLLGETKAQKDKYAGKYPYLTCEVGGGNQVTYHRRPLFSALDIVSLIITKIGNGVNLLGYYMYHGGINPLGKTTMQESKATGYPNDCPVLSYDFQSPIGDQGQFRESYFKLGRIHEFLHNFGHMLAPMDSLLPDITPKDTDDHITLRCAFRTDGKGGFLFVNNHTRLLKLPAHPAKEFAFVLEDRTIFMTVNVPEDCCFIMPVGLNLAGLEIDYITAQPVLMQENELTFEKIPGIEPVVVLKDGQKIVLQDGMNKIDDATILLVEPIKYQPTALHELSVQKVDSIHSANLLLGHLNIPDLTEEYEISWDAQTTYLVIRAQGNLAGFWADGRMISDYYLYGDNWVIDVRRLADRKGYIQYQPFRDVDKDTIYLECEFKPGVHVPSVWAADEPILCI